MRGKQAQERTWHKWICGDWRHQDGVNSRVNYLLGNFVLSQCRLQLFWFISVDWLPGVTISLRLKPPSFLKRSNMAAIWRNRPTLHLAKPEKRTAKSGGGSGYDLDSIEKQKRPLELPGSFIGRCTHTCLRLGANMAWRFPQMDGREACIFPITGFWQQGDFVCKSECSWIRNQYAVCVKQGCPRQSGHDYINRAFKGFRDKHYAAPVMNTAPTMQPRNFAKLSNMAEGLSQKALRGINGFSGGYGYVIMHLSYPVTGL